MDVKNELTHTKWGGVVLGEDFVFGPVRIQIQKMVQVTDAVSQRANREVLGCVRQQIPDQPLTYIKELRIAVIVRKRTDAETVSNNHQWGFVPRGVFLCGHVTQGRAHRL